MGGSPFGVLIPSTGRNMLCQTWKISISDICGLNLSMYHICHDALKNTFV